MTDEWKKISLSELCSYINRGSAPAYIKSAGVLVINQKCVRNQRVCFLEARRTDHRRKPIHADRMVKPFDILVNSTGVGTLGRVAQIRVLPEPATIDSHVTILRPNPAAIDPQYLGLAVSLLEGEIEALGEGSTGQTELSRSKLAAFVVPVAPKEQQRAIVRVIGALDDRIELNRCMNETLEAMARTLFQDWFVDFGPTRAKQEGRNPYLTPDLWSIFPERLDDEGKPTGWKKEPIGRHVQARKGLSYKGSGLTTSDAGEPLHNLNSVLEGGGYKAQGLKFYSGDYKPQHLVRPGDLLVANTEQGFDYLLIGYSAIVPRWTGDFGIFSHHIFKIEPRKVSPLSRIWLHFALSTSLIGDAIRRFSNGTTVNMLPADAFVLPEILVPSGSAVDVYDRLVQPMLDQKEALFEQSRTLAQTRDLLLPKLMSGEIRIQDAERTAQAIL